MDKSPLSTPSSPEAGNFNNSSSISLTPKIHRCGSTLNSPSTPPAISVTSPTSDDTSPSRDNNTPAITSTFKVIVFGDSGVGKHSLCSFFLRGFFVEELRRTVDSNELQLTYGSDRFSIEFHIGQNTTNYLGSPNEEQGGSQSLDTRSSVSATKMNETFSVSQSVCDSYETTEDQQEEATRQRKEIARRSLTEYQLPLKEIALSAQAILIMYDVTNKESFDYASRILNHLSTTYKEEGVARHLLPVIFMMGNKSDLRDDQKVSIEAAENLALNACECSYNLIRVFETSLEKSDSEMVLSEALNEMMETLIARFYHNSRKRERSTSLVSPRASRRGSIRASLRLISGIGSSISNSKKTPNQQQFSASLDDLEVLMRANAIEGTTITPFADRSQEQEAEVPSPLNSKSPRRQLEKPHARRNLAEKFKAFLTMRNR